MSARPDGTRAGERLDFSWTRRLPFIRQDEAGECGLACLAMIAAFHGNRAGLVELRRRFQPPTRGLTLADLVELATRLGFSARPVRLGLSDVPRLQRPCILHWNTDHFVVLKSVNRRRAVVLDPARGPRKLKACAFSRHFTGIALELTPTHGFECRSEGPALRLSDLWTRITGLKRSLLHTLLLSLALQGFAIAAPFYMQTVVDDVVLRGDSGLLTALAIGFSLLLAVETGTRALRAAVILQLSSRLHLQLAVNLFRHLVRLPVSWFQRRHLGDVLSRFSSLKSIREILSVGLVTASVDGFMAAVMLAIMAMYDLRLTLIVVGVLAIYSALRVALFPALRRHSRESIARHALAESSLLETVRAVQTIKLFQRESAREAGWCDRLADAMNSDIRLARLGIGLDAANSVLLGAGNIAVVFCAAHAVMANQLTLGMLFAFMSYKQRFVDAAERLVDQLFEVRMIGLHLQRISDIALCPPETVARESRATWQPQTREGPAALRCRGLAYRYGDTGPWLFRDLDIAVEPGKCLVITGPSGAGKSTLLKCLMGLLPTAGGQLLLDDAPVQGDPGQRATLAAVLQDDQLLSGSIVDNIACFDQRPDLERAVRAAQMACVHEEIARLPMQYQTPVGDMGGALSGGQVQRIMLARALYRGPRLLFLDEATSHVDLETESRINRNIGYLRITRVMVAHRPDTIAMADTVIELRGDEILCGVSHS